MIMGCYILSPKIFGILEKQKSGAGGEIMLTVVSAELNRSEVVMLMTSVGYYVREKLVRIEFAIALRYGL